MPQYLNLDRELKKYGCDPDLIFQIHQDNAPKFIADLERMAVASDTSALHIAFSNIVPISIKQLFLDKGFDEKIICSIERTSGMTGLITLNRLRTCELDLQIIQEAYQGKKMDGLNVLNNLILNNFHPIIIQALYNAKALEALMALDDMIRNKKLALIIISAISINGIHNPSPVYAVKAQCEMLLKQGFDSTIISHFVVNNYLDTVVNLVRKGFSATFISEIAKQPGLDFSDYLCYAHIVSNQIHNPKNPQEKQAAISHIENNSQQYLMAYHNYKTPKIMSSGYGPMYSPLGNNLQQRHNLNVNNAHNFNEQRNAGNSFRF